MGTTGYVAITRRRMIIKLAVSFCKTPQWPPTTFPLCPSTLAILQEAPVSARLCTLARLQIDLLTGSVNESQAPRG